MSAGALLSLSLRPAMLERMVSLAAAILLSTALLHALPRAFAAQADRHALCATLLAGLLSFFLLEKCAIMHHACLHASAGHAQPYVHDPRVAGRAGWTILLGDGLHNLSAGILIAAAFLADPQLGLATGFAIAAHGIAREFGDFIVLLDAGFGKARACVYKLQCSLLTMAGGLLGYLMLERGMQAVPYVLVLASSGFIYIAVSDLMPKMQRRESLRETLPQLVLIGLGVMIVLSLDSRWQTA